MSKQKRSETISAIADLFDISVVTTRGWVRRGLPHDRRGGKLFFSAPEVANWLRQHPEFGHGPGRRAEPESAELQAVRLRKLTAMADLYELRNAVDSGELVNVADFSAEMAEVAEKVKRPLLQLGAVLSPQLVGLSAGEIEQVLRDRMIEILRPLDAPLKICRRYNDADRKPLTENFP